MQVDPQYCAPIRRSATKHHLVAGCEPTALVLCGMVAAFIAYSVAPMKIGVTAGIVFFLVARQGLEAMARKDPMLIKLYLSSLRHRRGLRTARPSPYGRR